MNDKIYVIIISLKKSYPNYMMISLSVKIYFQQVDKIANNTNII